MKTPLKTMIAIMQAHAEGRAIQHRAIQDVPGPWYDSTPLWNWASHEYRVKPEPRRMRATADLSVVSNSASLTESERKKGRVFIEYVEVIKD